MPRHDSAPAASDRLRRAVQGLFAAAMARGRREAQSAGLSLSQLVVLRRLWLEGRLPATAWARDLGLTPSSLSGLIDELVKAGYLKRSRDAADRRRVYVSLSARGLRLAARLESDQRERWREMTRPFEASELHAASGLLERLARAVRDADRRTSTATARPRVPAVAPTGRRGGS